MNADGTGHDLHHDQRIAEGQNSPAKPPNAGTKPARPAGNDLRANHHGENNHAARSKVAGMEGHGGGHGARGHMAADQEEADTTGGKT